MVLPWVLGAAGLLIYLITLNKWASLYGLATVAWVSGWSWQPQLGQPLTCTVLLPFRCLPEPWIPLALNILAAVSAALVLVLLARSVALLRHDLTPDDPFRKERQAAILSMPAAWIPPVLAAMLCGLQLSFWERATSGAGEMIDLLVFAYVIRCLLEFRIDRDVSWLLRCACVYGAGMANDWALIGYFPVSLLAVWRFKGFRMIYDARFLLRMTLWGVAGLSLYLLLPTVYSLSPSAPVGFWTALKTNLKFQKAALSALRTPTFGAAALTSLLPVMILSIPWKSHTVQSGDDSQLGILLTRATGHFVHAVFFLIALWIGLDPAFSPRHRGLGLPMLSFYYLSALVAGYCAGYFLLFGSGRTRGFLPKLAVAAVYLLIGALPLALARRNLGQIRATNGPAVREFAAQLYADLPAGKSVVLSEDSTQLLLLRAELGARHHDKHALLLETPALVSPEYHLFMAREFKSRWPATLPTNGVEAVVPRRMVSLVSWFAAQEPVVYLHPSSGLFFERFTDLPSGSMHRLVARAATNWLTQTLDSQVAATNEQIWQERWTNILQTIAGQMREKPQYGPFWERTLLHSLRFTAEKNFTASVLGAAYAKSLDYWGVQMQRLGRWPEAGVWFGRALQLNPESLAARINSEFNQRCQRGDRSRLDAALMEKEFPDLFGHSRNWGEILSQDGPVDEPTYLFEAARTYLAGGHNRQAAREFRRCAELAPAWPEPRLWLALNYIDLRDFASALEQTDHIQASAPPRNGAGLARLMMCHTTALQGLGRTNEADACIESFVREYREREDVLLTAAEVCGNNRQFRGELGVLGELLRREPHDVKLLARKGWAELQLSKCDEASETLTQVLALDRSNEEARLHRAIAFLRAGRLEAAREDYQELLKTTASSQDALFGLGAIAWRKQDTNAAIELYEQYLSNGVPGLAQYRAAAARLRQLKAK